MSIICFEKHGRTDLQTKHDNLVKGGMDEKEAATKVVLDEHKTMADELNKHRAKVGAKPVPYEAPAIERTTTKKAEPESKPNKPLAELTPKKGEAEAKVQSAKRNSFRDFKKEFPSTTKEEYDAHRAGVMPKLGETGEAKGKVFDKSAYSKPTDALDRIAEAHPDNKLFQRAINFLRPIMEGNPDIKIDTGADFKNLEHKGKKLNPDALGYYMPDTKSVAINFDKMGSNAEGVHSTIIHELMHAATSAEIDKNGAFKDDLRKQLEDIRTALDTKVKGGIGDQLIPHLVNEGIIDKDKYGTANEHELIAEVFSNEKFRDMLRNLPAPDSTADAPKNMLQHIYEAIAKFLNHAYAKFQDAKSKVSASDMADYLMQLTEKTVGKDTEGGSEVHAKIDMEQKTTPDEDKDPEKIIKEALEMGKKSREEAKANPILNPGSPLIKILGRWFGDKIDDVSVTKGIIRKAAGTSEQAIASHNYQSEEILKDWNNVPKVKKLAFIEAMENPESLKNYSKATQDIAENYRKQLDEISAEESKYIDDKTYVENYFPRMWKDPVKAKNAFASSLSKTPLEGPMTFTKQRTLLKFSDGLKKGLEPVTDNPEELVRLRRAMSWQMRTGNEVFRQMKDEGLIKFSTAKDLNPDWKSINDPLFNKLGAYIDKDGDAAIAKGQYMASPEVAKLMNNYLSPGVGKIKNVVQFYNNLANSFQLGFGFYHYTTTGVESSVTSMTNGIQKISTLKPGNIGSGLLDVLKTPIAPFEQYFKGGKARKDYLTGKITDDVQSLMDANARVSNQKMYSLDAKYNLQKAFGKLRADADFSQVPKVLWHSLMIAPELVTSHLMNSWVPNLKVGGFLKSLESEIAARPGMTATELQRAKEQIWDSMDHRLGQVVYDNLFMNKATKDIFHMTVRSFGWSGGTVLTGAKGIGEIPLSVARAAKGQGITQRTAYALALPITVGIYGALIHKMMTGENPQSLEDYFFPKDGTKNPDGTDHRITIPSYVKDWISYHDKPVETALHKTAPLLNDIFDTYRNKDFYGEQIYNPKDPIYLRGLDVLKEEAKNMTPFSFRQRPGEETSTLDQITTGKGIRQKFGIMPAPRERERSETQNAITQAYAEHVDNGKSLTHAEVEKNVARRHLRQYIHDGGSLDDAPDDMLNKANIDMKQRHKFESDSKLDPYERQFKNLPSKTKIELFEKMPDKEKEQFRQYMPTDYEEK